MGVVGLLVKMKECVARWATMEAVRTTGKHSPDSSSDVVHTQTSFFVPLTDFKADWYVVLLCPYLLMDIICIKHQCGQLLYICPTTDRPIN